MFCTKCGNQIERPSKYCPVCGTELKQEASEQVNYTQAAHSTSYTPPVQPTSYTQTQQTYYAPTQQAAYAQTARQPAKSNRQPVKPNRQPVKPNRQRKKRRLSTGALIGIIAGGAAVLALLVFLGINLIGKDTKTNVAKPDIKAAGGVWSGILSFDEYFPGDSITSALVYASDDGILPCTLNVEKGGKEAELVVKNAIIPLTVEATEHALRFTGSMADEDITLNANIGAGGLVSLSGDGSITVGGEEIPFSLRLTQQSNEAPELSGGAGALPKPPAGTTTTGTEEAPAVVQDEAAPTSPAEPDNEPQTELPSLEQILPGTWVTNPDQDFGVNVFAYDKTGLMCHGIANSEGETTLEHWNDEGVWTLGDVTWCSWALDGDTVSMNSDYYTEAARIVPKSEDLIVIYYEGSDEGFEFHRVGGAPGLEQYMTGTWIPDHADENGYHAVLTLAADGSAVVTGAEGVNGDETPADWGNEDSWNILGTKEGTWSIESGGKVVIHVSGRDSTYLISIKGPDSVLLSYGSNWEEAYTRVY